MRSIVLLLSVLSLSLCSKVCVGEGFAGNQMILRVYSNFKKGLLENDPSASFEVRRIYFGYKGILNENFNAEVKLDIGSPDDLSQYSLIRRHAYFKTAAVTYHNQRLDIWFGLFDMQQFKLQENFWGYRYIYKSFLDEQKLGPSADIGTGIKYKISDHISADLVFSNGEGNRTSLNHDFIKQGTGITFSLFQNMTLRFYYDYINNTYSQSTTSVFAGYKSKKYRIGTEYNVRKNHQFRHQHHLYGFSTYGTFIITEKWEIFARYDALSSNIVYEDTNPWNIYNDNTAIISGIQFIPVDKLYLSINYQDRYSKAMNGPDKAYIYFNIQVDL